MTIAGLLAPVCVSAQTASSTAGTKWPVTCSGASSTNYAFTYVAGAVTVVKATVTVTANSLTIRKGAAVPAYTWTATGLQNSQTTSAFSTQPRCTSSYSTRSAAGTYTITCSSGSATNYSFVYRSGTLTVTP